LSDVLRVTAVSVRGHGGSDRPRSGYAPHDFAADLVALMDTLGIRRAVVVGHSMGATIAQRFAVDHPDRVLGLALVGAFAPRPASAAVRDFWESSVSRLTDPLDPAFVREFQQRTLAQGVPAAFFETVVRESLRVPARIWRDALKACMEVNFVPALECIKAPVLIVWGRHDAFAPRSEQDLLRRAIARSELIVYESAGHALHWEEPARFANDLARFIDGLTHARDLQRSIRR
jgi:pimeloyl-ACP methyl ester carboxylesterase